MISLSKGHLMSRAIGRRFIFFFLLKRFSDDLNGLFFFSRGRYVLASDLLSVCFNKDIGCRGSRRTFHLPSVCTTNKLPAHDVRLVDRDRLSKFWTVADMFLLHRILENSPRSTNEWTNKWIQMLRCVLEEHWPTLTLVWPPTMSSSSKLSLLHAQPALWWPLTSPSLA